MRRLIFALLLLIGATGAAFAQGAILQLGPSTRGHPSMWVNNGQQADPGPASGASGIGLSELFLSARGSGTPPYAGTGTGPLGTNNCNYDAPVSNATGYHYLCLSPNAQGGGLIAYGAAGGASQLPLNIIVNGSTYSFPSANSYTVATLPACSSGTKATRTFVTDGTASPALAATVIGGGSLFTPVYCDGSAWRNG